MIKEYTVNTPCGIVRGVPGKEVHTAAFKGIRYAEAERFTYPVQVTKWEGIYDASRFGACSFQPRAFYNEEDVPEKAFYYNEFRKGDTYTYSDDCLFLNIWAPVDAENAPVLFYIHGGGFKGGCGHEKHFSGEAYNREGVILVTCNYRLGVTGFLSLPELTAEAGHTGNYGLYDQLCALQWVKDNISAFGGNPDKITLMGQSAGAMSVQLHCVSPLSADMFQGAIMLSGGGVGKMMSACAAEEAYPFWQKLALKLGCAEEPARLRTMAARQLFQAYNELCREEKGSMKYAGPVVDGRLLVKNAFTAAQAGEQKNIPYLTSSTSEDMMPPVIHRMAKNWALLQSRQHKCDSYTAFFSRQLPGDDKGAWHSSDLWYAFGTLANGWRPFTEWDTELSNMLVAYYANFVKTGNPNGRYLPEWLPIRDGQKKVMCLGDAGVKMGSVSMGKLIHTMLTKPNVGE